MRLARVVLLRIGFGMFSYRSGSDAQQPAVESVSQFKEAERIAGVGIERKEIVQPEPRPGQEEVRAVRYARTLPKLQQKLEIAVEDDNSSPSKNMWQVYAIAGFMIARWMWARVKERRRRRFSGDDE